MTCAPRDSQAGSKVGVIESVAVPTIAAPRTACSAVSTAAASNPSSVRARTANRSR
ncbi:MAG: hypothetical protein M3P95_00030 [Actinomycetota bacterium]|nr:hypothetical protein [Actinomycetota bacterium]